MPAVVLIILCHKMVALRTDRANSHLILQMKAVCFLDFHTILLFMRRFREQLDLEAERECCLDTESAAFTQAYISAQLALLQLMKEESEENDHE